MAGKQKLREGRDMSRMPMIKSTQTGQMVPSMLVRMRCESCYTDHRMLIAIDTPLGALPELTKSTFRCNCKRHIPTITKMDKSLMSINGTPFAELKGLAAMSAPRVVEAAR